MNANGKTIKDNMEDTAAAARKALAHAADATMDTAKSFGEEVSSRASDTVAAVRDTASERVAEARDALSDTGDRLAETLQRASEAPDAGHMQARVLSAVASGVSTVADTLRERGLADIAADIQGLARRNPAAFAAGAAVAGFMLARFLRASSARAEASHTAGRHSHGESRT